MSCFRESCRKLSNSRKNCPFLSERRVLWRDPPEIDSERTFSTDPEQRKDLLVILCVRARKAVRLPGGRIKNKIDPGGFGA